MTQRVSEPKAPLAGGSIHVIASSTWSSDWQKASLLGRGMGENAPENTLKKEEPAAHEGRHQHQHNRNLASSPQQRKVSATTEQQPGEVRA